MALADKIARRLGLDPRTAYLDRPTAKPTVLLASSTRSGSTWVQDLIARSPGYRVMFEPFDPQNVDRLAGWASRQYIGRGDPGSDFAAAAADIVLGRVRGTWVDKFNRSSLPRRRLIKAVRANLCLAWLKQRHPHVRVVLLLRHPFAVARSRLSLGWGADLDSLLAQRDLVDHHLADHADTLHNLHSPFARQVAWWVIENLVPLRELHPGDALAIAYEDIKADPAEELRRLADHLGHRLDQVDADTLARPSKTTTLNKSGPADISPRELDEAAAVLRRFGLDRIFMTDEHARPHLADRDLFDEFGGSR